MDFFDLIEKRKSIRKFSGKPVEKEKLDKILNSIIKAPSAGNMQSFEIFVLNDKEKQKKLFALKPTQTFLLEATYVLIFCINQKKAKERFNQRGSDLYCFQDAAIACTYAHLCCVELGLSSVWVGSFSEVALQEICNIPSDLTPVSMLPIGYPAEDPIPKSRRDLNDLVKYVK